MTPSTPNRRPSLARSATSVAAAPYILPPELFDSTIRAQSRSPRPPVRPDAVHDEKASVPAALRRSSSTASTIHDGVPDEDGSPGDASRVSTDAYGNTYPEGGFAAWFCVFGSFCGLMCALGMMNTIGTYQAYLSANQLSDQTESAVGWIFGIYAFLSFFCGIQIGPWFDAKGPRVPVALGSVLILATYLLLGLCTSYWHFLLVFGVLGGFGTSLVFTPAVAAVGHWFLRRRGSCTGLAAAGGSLGGIVYPLTLKALFPKIGFAWSCRVIALINLVLLIIANLGIRSRLPPKKATKEAILPDLRIFRDRTFALTTAAVFFMEWGLFVPISYLISYALAQGVDESLSYNLIVIFNAASTLGRYLPGLVADKVGRFNAMLVMIAFGLVSIFGLWMPARSSEALNIIFALAFGFASGSGISLTPVCVGQLCRVENYGRYYATCFTVVSFASLTGIPIAGQLISTAGGRYEGLIGFTGAAYAVSFCFYYAAKVSGAGWKITGIF
ncbi:Riboflavin transporter MCH5 [Cyphellophora attinorum]|uniref:Riboflavin transporter MCH5 n=1 Tax=Cyphellophora attinorum TaxID=1664694 RepID=A0A0N0NN95_9EURO|nr:Riboflavin transporter MCH5 [Phialophora attinorum]KPI41109.1 Riboflavin transporter MCH5 [Phialophora attinorum]